jgi:hypothetical protein
MLIAAFIILGIAVSIGSGLAIQHLRTEGAKPPPWPLALLHGLFAIVGLGCLVLALRGPPRGLDQGTGSFGIIAAALIVMAAPLRREAWGSGFCGKSDDDRPVRTTQQWLFSRLAVPSCATDAQSR